MYGTSATLLTTCLLLFAILREGECVTYTRWGRTTCDNKAEALYKGYTAGTFYNHEGGGSEFLCLPRDPQWGNFVPGCQQGNSKIHGTEYELLYEYRQEHHPFSFRNNDGNNLHDNDAPCVVCRQTSKKEVMMIPARTSCLTGWNLEYKGYVVSSHAGHRRNGFVCLDEAPEVIKGGEANTNGALFHPVEAMCGALPCPEYVEGRELACVVCTI